MHARTGLDTEYLGSEFLDLVSLCVDEAEKRHLLACLYANRFFSSTQLSIAYK